MLACTRLALHKGKEMRDMTEANRAEFEAFMAERFTDSIDRRRCINGDGNDYMSWDMGVARAVWQHMQQKLDAVLAENVALKNYLQECSVVQGKGNWTSDAEKSVYVPATEWLPPTPATDALLNAVRAEAIEQAAEKAPWLYGDQMGRSVEAIPKEQLVKWASRLRAETDTTPSQYESLAGGK